MSEDTAKQMVVEIEKCRITESQITDYEQAVNNLNEQIKKQEEQIETQRKALEEASKIISEKDALIESAKKSCPKPSILSEVLKGLGFIGIGIIMGVLL
jgi:methyl-accepting chemotaxis protein